VWAGQLTLVVAGKILKEEPQGVVQPV
jgi:hypothetical protein